MEYVEGRSLDQVIPPRGLAFRQALAYAAWRVEEIDIPFAQESA